MFSELIFEAIIVGIDYSTNTCSVSPFSANTDSIVDNVKLPYLAGTGNAGLFVGLSVGTRVVCGYTAGRSRESAVILTTIPKAEHNSDVFDPSSSSDIRRGTQSYPVMRENKTVLRGNLANEICLSDNGDVSMSAAGGGGIYLRKNGINTSFTLVSEDMSSYNQSGRKISGSVNRISPSVRSLSQKEGLMELPLFADSFYPQLADPIGFFPGSDSLNQTFGNLKRNPEISENRVVINEFSTDTMFTGFEDEVLRHTGQLSLYQDRDAFERNRESGNVLHLAEHELIEIVGGNLVDINGDILDLNYRSLSYGGPSNTVPTKDLELSYDRARRVSRRGVGYHFQLGTNVRKSDPSSYETNFVFDLDKEGVIKINVPRSSNTGNIPFVSRANYLGPGDSVDVSFAKESQKERIPVVLRDANGEVLIPAGLAEDDGGRDTGVRFSNDQKSPYFPSSGDSAVSNSVRVNTTKYHNMYAAGERLFGAQIERIFIPESFGNTFGIVGGNIVGQPFEVPVPQEDQEGESATSGLDQLEELADLITDPTSLIDKILGDSNNDGYPAFMSTVGISPAPPAMYPGGDTVVGGFIYEQNDISSPPYSNLFELEVEGSDVVANIIDENGNPAKDSGGKSLNANFEGSIEMSIGKDNTDNKSIVLDTDGSFLSWIGKDANGRSIITQTDGGVFLNIGGSYQDQDSEEPVMNIGRFTLRVNVVDKGFVDSQFDEDSTEEDGPSNPMGSSDFLIDISEAGIVIAGMLPEVPMIIRNSGKILIESADNLVLKGNQVQIVEARGKAKTLKSGSR